MASSCKLLLEEVPSIWESLQWQHNTLTSCQWSAKCTMHEMP